MDEAEAREFGRGLAKDGLIRKEAQDVIDAKFGMFTGLDEVALNAFDDWRQAEFDAKGQEA